MPPPTTAFEVYVAKETFKFNAAHFVAFEGYRERLHGHNYNLGVRLLGERQIGADGYLIDFGIVKDVCKKRCKAMNEHFLCPMQSNVLDIAVSDNAVKIICQDKAEFVFPRQDCILLPIVHATAEELAIFMYGEILKGLDSEYLRKRGIHTMEITVAEAIGQEATFRLEIPGGSSLDVKKYIMEGDVVPMPCIEKLEKPQCCPDCSKKSSCWSKQLSALAEALNSGTISGTVTERDLDTFLSKSK